MASTGNNNINTTLGESILSSINTVFTDRPYLNQTFNEDVVKCAKENLLSDCDNPPSINQIDNDIQKADAVLEFLLLNDCFDRDTKIFQFQTIINFLKVKKCINGQYPCWSDAQYQENKEYIYSFDFTTS